VHAFQANDAVLLQTLVHARVVILHRNVQTAPAIVAVEKIVLATHSADATLLTVEDAFFLPFVVVKGTNGAEVPREVFIATRARFRLWLLSLAPQALHVRHLAAIQLMILFGVELLFV